MKIRVFSLITLMITLLALNACGVQSPPPDAPVDTPPPTPTFATPPVVTKSVAILVLDDFMDEITGESITLGEYEGITDKVLEALNAGDKNCVYTTEGQAAVVGKGAAAVVGKGADGSEIRLPAPHGVVVFNELREVVKRDTTNVLVSQNSGEEQFGPLWGWISNIDTYDHEGFPLALVGIDVSDYTTRTIAERLRDAVIKLGTEGYDRFVINLSFVIIPCPDLLQPDGDALTQANATYEGYRAIINADPDLDYLHETLDALGGVGNYVDEDGNMIDGKAALVRLAFNPDFGRLRLRYYYSSPVFSKDPYGQVLNDDPVRNTVLDLSETYPGRFIPIAASGNDGIPYPYAPAMWDTVLSVGAPISDPDPATPMATPRQSSSFVDNSGEIAQFFTNSGEVVAEGCTTYTDIDATNYRIPGTSFAAPKLSYLAALYLLQDDPLRCTGGDLEIFPTPPLGYATEVAGDWINESVPHAAERYCSEFPTAVPNLSCPPPP